MPRSNRPKSPPIDAPIVALPVTEGRSIAPVTEVRDAARDANAGRMLVVRQRVVMTIDTEAAYIQLPRRPAA